MRLTTPGPQPGREQLRYLVIGSPKGVGATINLLVEAEPGGEEPTDDLKFTTPRVRWQG